VPDPQLEITSNWTIAGGFEPTLTLLDLPDPPTAIFCFNDNLAVGALRAARGRGVRGVEFATRLVVRESTGPPPR
jgi:DNA-binding LacI/PurR family transcriptional regulator